MAMSAQLPVGSPPAGRSMRETDHHLVVSWICWRGRRLDRPGGPKCIVRLCWDHLAGSPAREVFNSHIQKSFTHLLKEAGNIESEWSMFSASIADAVALSCGHKVSGAVLGVIAAGSLVDTGRKGHHQAEGVLLGHVGQENFPSNRCVLAGQAGCSSGCPRCKNLSLRRVWGSYEERLESALKRFWQTV